MWNIECWSGGDLLSDRYKYVDLDDGNRMLRYQLQEDIDSRYFEIMSAMERLEQERIFLIKNHLYLTCEDVPWPE